MVYPGFNLVISLIQEKRQPPWILSTPLFQINC
jgi:hypothetical protein